MAKFELGSNFGPGSWRVSPVPQIPPNPTTASVIGVAADTIGILADMETPGSGRWVAAAFKFGFLLLGANLS